MKPTPPKPLFHGSTAASAKPVATAASTALPPAARIFAPASPAMRFCVATMPAARLRDGFAYVPVLDEMFEHGRFYAWDSEESE